MSKKPYSKTPAKAKVPTKVQPQYFGWVSVSDTLDFTSVTYKGSGGSVYSCPQYRGITDEDTDNDEDDDERYVWLSKNNNFYMKSSDFKARLVAGFKKAYTNDWAITDPLGPAGAVSAFPLWGPDGKISSRSALFWRVEDPAKMRKAKNTSGVEPDRTLSQLDAWIEIANTVEVATPPAPYNVLGRFWVPPALGITFYLDPASYLKKGTTTAQQVLQNALDTTLASSTAYNGNKYQIVAPGTGKALGRIQWSENYLRLYTSWLSAADFTTLRAAEAADRNLPTEAEAKEADDLITPATPSFALTTNTKLTASKIKAASGQRSKVPGQAKVMGEVSATQFAEIFWDKKTLGKLSGLADSEWLHRSAFSFGGLGDPANFHTSQVRRNLVFGTSQANTFMIRPENAIKDVIQAQKTQFGTLETKLITADPSPPANAWMNTKQYFWLAPKLQYDFTFNTPNEFNQALNGQFTFPTFSQRIPLRVEAKLDEEAISEFYS